jgi:hypothetical protein
LTAFTALRADFIIPAARELEPDDDDFFEDADDDFAFERPLPPRLADALRLDDAPERLALDDIDRLVVDDLRADEDAFFVPPRALPDDARLPPPRFDAEPFDDPPFFDLPDARFAACLAMRPPFGTRILTGNWAVAKRAERFQQESGLENRPGRQSPAHASPRRKLAEFQGVLYKWVVMPASGKVPEMGLQVKVRHALGERVLELPSRGAEGPLVVGRTAEADLQVPSVHVGMRHLLLFVRDGRWFVQDAPGGTGTSVNGTLLKGPQPLRGGDVLTLGTEPDPPSLEIDPASIPTELPAPAVEALPPTAAAGRQEPSTQGPAPAAPSTSPAATATGPQLAPPLPEVIVEGAPAEHAEERGAAAWPRPAEEAPAPRKAERPAKPGPRKSSVVAVALSMVAAVAIVTGAVVFVYLRQQQIKQEQQQQRTPVVLAPSPAPSTVPGPATKANTVAAPPEIAPPPPPADITDDMEEPRRPATGRSVAVVSPAAPTTAPSSKRRTESDGAPDPQFFGDSILDDGSASDEEKEWKRVEGVYYHPSVAKALLTFDSYAEKYPDAHKDQIAKYREDMLDKLWWTRIEGLIDKRKSLAADIKKTEADVKAESEEAFRKTVLEPRLADQKTRLAAVTDRLRKQMMYNIDAPPPIGREPQMKALRAKRDRIVYEEWKKTTLKYIRENHGLYPWANEE